jgi:hypothetical protein
MQLDPKLDPKEENGVGPSERIRAVVGGNTCCPCARELASSDAGGLLIWINADLERSFGVELQKSQNAVGLNFR